MLTLSPAVFLSEGHIAALADALAALEEREAAEHLWRDPRRVAPQLERFGGFPGREWLELEPESENFERPARARS